MQQTGLNDRQTKNEVGVFVSVSGSFNKFPMEINSVVRQLRDVGAEVLSPKSLIPDSLSSPSGADQFVVLKGDKGLPADIEMRHLQAIAKSDFLYVVDPEGYIGVSTALEIGYALAKGVPVYTEFAPLDVIFQGLTISVKSPEYIVKKTLEDKKCLSSLKIKNSPSLRILQNYVSATVKERGFADEGNLDVMLLLTEEVGELAKAIRYRECMKVKREEKSDDCTLQNELADCLIYLINLANLNNIDLEKAIRNKETINSRRAWTTASDISNH